MTDVAEAFTPPVETLKWLIAGQGAASEVRVHCFAGTAEAGAYVSQAIVSALRDGVAARGHGLWLGCGGSTPKPVYEGLSAVSGLDWSKVTLAQLDERFVPVDDAASNTRMMRAALSPVLAAGMELISLIQDINDQAACAAKAGARLLALGPDAPPLFDFALMGMGPDAHYASIFPGHAINATVYGTSALVVPVAASGTAMEPVLPRITLSVPAINNTRRIMVYMTGQTKLDVLKSASRSTDPYTSPIGAFLAQCPAPVEFVWAP